MPSTMTLANGLRRASGVAAAALYVAREKPLAPYIETPRSAHAARVTEWLRNATSAAYVLTFNQRQCY